MADSEETWFGLDARAKPLARAGVLIGVGLGGFFDGIVLHQILQWHHMLSAHPDASVAGDLELNVLADGLFHAVTYAFTVVGIVALWRARLEPRVPGWGRVLLGTTILGWGLFNVVEGLVDHHLLAVHHVWPDGPGPVLLWDLAFLAWGAVFLVGGYLLARSADVADGSSAPGAEPGE